jgi:hypothetical protein
LKKPVASLVVVAVRSRNTPKWVDQNRADAEEKVTRDSERKRTEEKKFKWPLIPC